MNIWPYLSDRERFEFSLRHAATDRQVFIDWSFLSIETRLAILREKFLLAKERMEENLPHICQAYELKYPKHPGNTPEHRLDRLNNLFESMMNSLLDEDRTEYMISTFGHTVIVTNYIDLELRFDLFDEEEDENFCSPSLTKSGEYAIIEEE